MFFVWCCSTMPTVNSCKTIEKLYEIGNSKIIQTTLYSYFRIVHSTNFSLVYNVSWSFFLYNTAHSAQLPRLAGLSL